MVLSAALGLLADRETTDIGRMRYHRHLWELLQTRTASAGSPVQVASGKFWVSLSLTRSILNWNVLSLHSLAKDGGVL